MASFLVTGALGCIGAWVVKQLAERGDQPVVFDMGGDARRIRDVLDQQHLARVQFVHGDIADAEATKRAVAACAPRAIVHLAGLQAPLCRANPVLGARIDVIGTINVFEAAAAAGVPRVVYASSASVFGQLDPRFAVGEHAPCEPVTHYGVHKRAIEGSARVFWLDKRVASVGLRLSAVYGVGRDQGLTAAVTTAMKAAVLGRSFRINFEGQGDFHYVADTAAAFVACADGGAEGALLYNLHGDTVDVADSVQVIEDECPAARDTITCFGPPLKGPPRLDDRSLRTAYPQLPHTPLAAGVRETIARFHELAARGTLDVRDLPAA